MVHTLDVAEAGCLRYLELSHLLCCSFLVLANQWFPLAAILGNNPEIGKFRTVVYIFYGFDG